MQYSNENDYSVMNIMNNENYIINHLSHDIIYLQLNVVPHLFTGSCKNLTRKGTVISQGDQRVSNEKKLHI